MTMPHAGGDRRQAGRRRRRQGRARRRRRPRVARRRRQATSRRTVLTGVTPEMAIAEEETFGPVHVRLPRQRRRRGHRARQRHRSTASARRCSRPTTRAPAASPHRLRAGSTVVNDFGLAYMANALPFGGVGGSGYGRLNGREGIRAMCNQKSVHDRPLPVPPAGQALPGRGRRLRAHQGHHRAALPSRRRRRVRARRW